MFKKLWVGVVAGVLVGCGVPQPRPMPPPVAPTGDAGLPAAQPRRGGYHIDSAQSELRLLVYRAGSMARLGHNHVIVNRQLTGSVDFVDDVSTAAFSVSIPVAGFAVDETAMRLQEGADFPGDIPEDAKSGTLHNMLSPALLNGAQFPTITLRSLKIAGIDAALIATVKVSVAGHDSTLTTPITLTRAPGRLAATGTLSVQQSALGLTPYSVLLGALQVQDELRVKFTIVALEG